MKQYIVYIMASFRQTLYVGVTNDLNRRVQQHKAKADPASFTARYNIDRLAILRYSPTSTMHWPVKSRSRAGGAVKRWR
jgi:putative endonuclease